MKFKDYLIRTIGTTAVKYSETDAEMIRAAMQEELEAINDYTERAKNAQNEATKKLFIDIANEEKTHFEEFEALLEAIDSTHEDAEENAEEEIEDLFGENEEDEDETE